MASTNKTTNYELSQFLGTDKPAWLTDYNTDMSKIDSGIHTAQTTATGADGKADTNATSIGTLANLTTDAKTSLVLAVNEVDSHADTAQGTANDASALANSNKQEIDALKAIFNINVINDYTSATVSTTGCTFEAGDTITVATDSTGAIFKVYGVFSVVPTVGAGQNYTITLPNTGIPTTTPYYINPAGFTSGNDIIDNISMQIQNNQIVITGVSRGNGVRSYARMLPCLYFNTDFGDES